MIYPGQLNNPRFRKLWLSDSLTSMSDQIEMLVMSWVIITKTESGLILGIYTAIRFFSTIFAPFIGGIIDNFNKKNSLLTSRSYMLLHSLIFLFVSYFEQLSTYRIIFITFFYGLARTSDRISRESLTQLLVPKKDLRNASGILRSTMDFSKIIGPIIGAWVYSYYGITETYILIALLYFISIIIILPVKIDGINKKSTNIITEIKIGILYLRESKILISVIIAAGLANLILFTLPQAYLPFIIKDIIKGNASDLAMFNAFLAIGALAGSLLLSIKNLSNNPGKLIFISLFLWHCIMLITSIVKSKLFLSIILFMYGVAGSISMISMAVLILSIAKKDMIGRVIGIRQLAIFTLPIGLIISGYLIDIVGILISLQVVTILGSLLTLILTYKSKNLIMYRNNN
ncbi:MAG: MFS transporter [Dehalococcoidia bacterium]